jgi:transposase
MKIAQYPTCVSDFQWHILSSMLPKARRLGRPRTCLRRVLNAVLFVLKSGCPWRMLPKDFPAWKTVYHHFRAWSRSGILAAINACLRKMVRRLEGRSNNPSAGIIDSQSVRSDGHGGLVGYDAGKKIKGRKRFVCVDTLGMLLGVAITPANVPERAGAKELLQPILRTQRLGKIWADGGFSGPEFSNWVSCQRSSTKVEIVKRISENAGFHILPKRWVVERTFAWIVQNRRLVRDYERSPQCAAAWVFLAMIRVMINRYS